MIKELKGYLKEKEGEIQGVASTEFRDRAGEIIKQDGWDLKEFKKNPVILASHNHFKFPIGKATKIGIEKGKLVFKMVLSEATQEAREAAQLVKEGILKTFSVGFIPKERDEKDGSIITKSELLEISLVSIPANPQAVVTAKSLEGNNLAQEMIKDWLLNSDTSKRVKAIEEGKQLDKEKQREVNAILEEREKDIEKIKSLIKEEDFNNDVKKEISGLFIKEVERIKTAKELLNIKATGKDNNTIETGKAGKDDEVQEQDRLLQKAVGMLQEVCRHNKETRKGGEEK